MFVVGLGFPVGGLVGCWWGVSSLSARLLATAARGVLSLSWLTASNCGKWLPKVLQQLRQGFRRWLSVFGACNGGGSVAVLARWLPVLLSPLGGCPFCLWCCVRVAPCCPVGRWPHLLRLSFGVGVRLGSVCGCGFGGCLSVAAV